MERLENTKKMVRLEIQQQLARYAACVRETGASERAKNSNPSWSVRYVNNVKYEKEARDALLRCIVSSLNEVAEVAGGE